MIRQEIVKLDGKVIDKKILDEIQKSEDVKAIRDNGMDATHIGKRWYVVVFHSGEGISVYVNQFI
ncbi:MAG: hypothetical protein SOR72_07190 [Hornefia sp.]|nr:hypothetical protein [Hornefia sp.]